MITKEQKRQCILMYSTQDHSIKEILQKTGIRSEQTLYRILDEAGVPRLHRRRGAARKVTISVDQDTADLLDLLGTENRSKFVCECIREYCHIPDERKREIEDALISRCSFYKGEAENPFDKDEEEDRWFLWDMERGMVSLCDDPLYIYKYKMKDEDDWEEYFREQHETVMDMYRIIHGKSFIQESAGKPADE